MEYRFTMTTRLIALALISFFLLLGLLFALGFQLGEQWARDDARLKLPPINSSLAPAMPAAPVLTVPALPTTALPTVAAPTVPLPIKN